MNATTVSGGGSYYSLGGITAVGGPDYSPGSSPDNSFGGITSVGGSDNSFGGGIVSVPDYKYIFVIIIFLILIMIPVIIFIYYILQKNSIQNQIQNNINNNKSTATTNQNLSVCRQKCDNDAECQGYIIQSPDEPGKPNVCAVFNEKNGEKNGESADGGVQCYDYMLFIFLIIK